MKPSANTEAWGMEDMNDDGLGRYLYVINRTLIDGI